MLSLLGWITGIIGLIYFIYALIIGLYFFFQARKIKAKLLLFAGLSAFVAAFLTLAQVVDFFTVLLTGNNNQNIVFLIIVYSWWVFIVAFLMFFTFSSLILPEKRWPLITVLVMNIIGEFILLFNANGVFYIVFPINPGENLIQVRLIINPINIFLISYGSFTIIIALIGFLLKSIQSQGVMRRKYLYLFISTFTIAFVQVLESLIDIGYGIILTRISILIAVFLWYYSLREMKEKKEPPQKKEVDVKDSLFMIARRPEQINQEDVTFHKEQKICLVCKGKVSRVSYICPNCSALYCINCSEVLSTQENACWICNEPFDESKPSKPFKKEEEEVKVIQLIAHFLKKKKKKSENNNK